jgi:hypothetical protein
MWVIFLVIVWLVTCVYFISINELIIGFSILAAPWILALLASAAIGVYKKIKKQNSEVPAPDIAVV